MTETDIRTIRAFARIGDKVAGSRFKQAIEEPFLIHVSGAYGELLAAENTEHAQAAREALVETVELAKSYGFTRQQLIRRLREDFGDFQTTPFDSVFNGGS
jgi:hypothetical protein